MGKDEAHEPARDLGLVEDGVDANYVGERVVAPQTQGVPAAAAGAAAPGQARQGPILSKVAFEALSQDLLRHCGKIVSTVCGSVKLTTVSRLAMPR